MDTYLSFFIGFLTATLLFTIFIIVIYTANNSNEKWTTIDNSNRKIYYSRDNAGINNVRLQFETLIVLCYLTNRTLMIPSPSIIDHYDRKFTEFDILDYDLLNKYIKVEIYTGSIPTKNIYKHDNKLYNSNYKTFPTNKDWWFNSSVSRIQHFQCLRLSEKDKERANKIITDAIGIKQELFDILDLVSDYLNIRDGNYNAVHIRRGDFLKTRKHLIFDEKQLAQVIRKNIKSNVPLFISTNAEPDFINNLKTILSDYKILTSRDYEIKLNDKVQQAMADMLICANAHVFFGTPLSTFSTGIIQFRRVLSYKFNKNIKIEAKSIIPGQEFKEDYSVTGRYGECWDLLTRFK
jgi:hypothetical protein